MKSMLSETDKKQKEATQQKEETVKHMTQKDMKERNLIDQLTAIVAEKVGFTDIFKRNSVRWDLLGQKK